MKSTVTATLLSLCLSAAVSAQVQINRAFSKLTTFIEPVVLTHAGDGSDRLFVAEQRGVIYVFENRNDVDTRKTFLDIRARVNDDFSESGLLGLAFHPNFTSNGKFYLNYTTGSGRSDLTTRISEFMVSGDPDAADPASERILMAVAQPATNHNGGHVAFGPDSLLYIALGDGGGANDQFQNGQDRTTLLGTILRIDVDRTTGDLQYAIPADNPFAGNGNGWREEIWAWGLRNPWRFSFDRADGTLWAADVGQGDWEEIDIIEKGQNYGWNIMEGLHCFLTSNCNTTGLTLPVFEYDHRLGRSVTGGYVYRGTLAPALRGLYLYGDYVSRRVWALRYENGQVVSNTQIGSSPGAISSFGEDEAGEVYITGHDNGRIYRFEDSTTGVADENDLGNSLPVQLTLYPAYPNPFNPSTTIAYELSKNSHVELSIYNKAGQLLRTLVNGERGAGTHSVLWRAIDAAGVPVASGVYFVRLRVGELQQTRKVVLAK